MLARLHARYIKFPSTVNERVENRTLFRALGRIEGRAGIPGVDGAIDCSHIRIVNTPGQQHREAYRNRKSYFSINVQVTVIIK